MKIKKLKYKWDKFLKKLEKANKESFGNNRLDCCKLNKGDKK